MSKTLGLLRFLDDGVLDKKKKQTNVLCVFTIVVTDDKTVHLNKAKTSAENIKFSLSGQNL